ncbi:BON domain-containing protein [Methylomonas methanica]|uniref:Transporter n=1 Tax=Methylomonas methanica TaxID=421 RepID=A0A177LT43_METMH|nr:BON domain-containing protein [Methylomonas methanica]OAH96169.1 transporter [Methylomonas methanica]OAH96987.1 transporter [Methylomonas methanica]
MSTKLLSVIFTLTSSLIMMTGTVRAEQNSAVYLAADSTLENTEINARDKDNSTLTPEDQKETEGDIKITAAIRQAVVKNESLSVNAQNVKIITRNGVVTLRGPVKNEAEKIKLQDIAKQTPGVLQVNNNLEFKAP